MGRAANVIVVLILLAGGLFYLAIGSEQSETIFQQVAGGTLATAFFVLMLVLTIDYRFRQMNKLLEQQNELLLILARRGKAKRPAPVDVEKEFSLEGVED